MDTVFTIITKENKHLVYGADHFGYEDKMLKAVDILIKDINSKGEFITSHLYPLKSSYEASSDIIIDDNKKIVVITGGFVIKKGNDIELPHVSFTNIGLMLNEEMSYKDFNILYDFFLKVKNYDLVVINNQYIYQPQLKK